MNHDLYVLRALARLSRQRKTVDYESLAIRAGGTNDDVCESLERLAAAHLVDRSGTAQGIRLTMAGLAVAVASAKVRAAAARKPGAVAIAPRARPARKRAA